MNQNIGIFDPRAASRGNTDNASSVQVSIVVPTYQEAENLPELVARLFVGISVAQWNAELIVVDDNSDDGTVEVCEGLAEFYPLRLITRTGERGLATAVIRGLKEAVGEYVVVMDADLSHPPVAVPALLNSLQTSDTDFVIGSRYIEGGSIDRSWSLLRHLNSRVAGWLARGLTTAKDPMAGFFAIRKEKLGDLSKLNPCGYKIGLEIMVRCGCRRVTEVPIHFEDRRHGESKLNLREQWLYIMHLLRLYRFRYPESLQFATFSGVGASGLVIDVLLFRSLLPVTGLAAGRALAIWSAMTWNFYLNRRFTFSVRSDARPLNEYLRFCCACFFGAVTSWGTALGLVMSETIHAAPVPAALIGTGFAAVLNYTLCKLWVFGKRRNPLIPVILEYPERSGVAERVSETPPRLASSA